MNGNQSRFWLIIQILVSYMHLINTTLPREMEKKFGKLKRYLSFNARLKAVS